MKDEPRGMCDRCGRKTWDPARVGKRCLMRQPSGSTCRGTVQRMGMEREPCTSSCTSFSSLVCVLDHDQAVAALRVAELPQSQRQAFRHVCAGCAYDLGYKKGLEGGTVKRHALDEAAYGGDE